MNAAAWSKEGSRRTFVFVTSTRFSFNMSFNVLSVLKKRVSFEFYDNKQFTFCTHIQ
jgi:hypothetical protein